MQQLSHCRPDSGDSGTWVKLGWAYNTGASVPQQELANEPLLNMRFPEIVLRGAICAAWIAGSEVPEYARQVCAERYAYQDLMSEIRCVANRGIL